MKYLVFSSSNPVGFLFLSPVVSTPWALPDSSEYVCPAFFDLALNGQLLYRFSFDFENPFFCLPDGVLDTPSLSVYLPILDAAISSASDKSFFSLYPKSSHIYLFDFFSRDYMNENPVPDRFNPLLKIHPMKLSKETAHAHGFTFNSSAQSINKPTYPVRSPVQRNNVLSFSRPIKNRPPAFQNSTYALASRRSYR